MSTSPRILIIRLSSLGDILHTLPAFAGLRAAFPSAKIDWLVAGQFKFLLSTVRGIDALHELNTNSLQHSWRKRSAWHKLWNTILSLRQQRYDFSIDFQGLLKTALISSISGAQKRLGFSKELVREFPAHWFYHRTLDKPAGPVHVLALNQMLAQLAGAKRTPAICDFIVADDDQSTVDSLLEQKQLDRFIVINPGGGWYTKRWNPKLYGILAKKIREELGFPVIVTTGPGEEELYRTIAANCSGAPPLHFPVSFLQLVPLFQKARLLIGGDTGPFHLACALGTPVVGIFGPTSPIRNGPWRESDEVVAHTLPCSFCYGRTCDTKNECMDITVNEVFSAIIRRLKSPGESALG
jgi:heptosyltransferase-1